MSSKRFPVSEPRTGGVARRDRAESGQAIVILTVAVAAVLAMTALIVDGGNAMAQQRGTQNAADAGAYAGATVLVEHMAGEPRVDVEVHSAIQNALDSNENTTLVSAEYVNYDNASVGTVGGTGAIPASAGGVRVTGGRDFGTYFAGIVGMGTMQVGAQATAMAGAVTGICPASEGCAVTPVTFSIPVISCDGTNRPFTIGGDWPLVSGIENANDANMSIVPLCSTGPGSVGWLDLSEPPANCPPGNLAKQIEEPCNQAFDVPVWLGNKTGVHDDVEDEMNAYRGQVILIPMFDGTCEELPAGSALADCPTGREGKPNPGQGDRLWYHIPHFAAFLLHEAYIRGNQGGPCSSLPGLPLGGGNGATNCVKGWFLRWITVGPVGPVCRGDPIACSGRNAVLGIQLVR